MADVGIGFRIKTAKTIVVAVRADPELQLVGRDELVLADTNVPASFQPFHAGLDKKEGAAHPVVVEACEAARASALTNVTRYVEALRSDGHRILQAGLVVNSIHNPDIIKNDHIRAHASEGRLFFEVVEAALTAADVPSFCALLADCYVDAGTTLTQPDKAVKAQVAVLGKTAGPPWRADEKAACAVAWAATFYLDQ